MADDESVDTSNSQEEVVDTSTNDEPESLDQILDDMDQIEVNIDEEEESEDTEQSEETEETGAEESTEEESTDDSTEEETSEEEVQDVNADTQPAEEEKEAEQTEEEDTTSVESSEEAQKRFNDEQAKRRIAEKQLREAQEAQEREHLDRYLKEAGEDQAELQRRQLEVQQFNLQRERAQVLNEGLRVGIDKAVASIPLFRDGTKEQKEELARRLDLFEAINVVKDQHGNTQEVKADVYQYLKDEADSITRLSSVGARKQEKAKKVEKTRTVTPPAKTPKQPKADPLLEGFDEEAGLL